MTTDPLANLPDAERHVFEAFKNAATGKPADAVVGAAMNVIINAIRQIEPTRKEAEARYDALFGRGKTLLIDRHYDSVTGRRKTVFPFTQSISMPMHVEDDTIRG